MFKTLMPPPLPKEYRILTPKEERTRIKAIQFSCVFDHVLYVESLTITYEYAPLNRNKGRIFQHHLPPSFTEEHQ